MKAFISSIAAVLLASAIAHSAEISGASRDAEIAPAGDGAVLLSQYLRDDKQTADQQATPPGPRPLFMMGLSGSVSNMEGLARVSAAAVLGILYSRFHFTLDPEFNYTRTKSAKSKKILPGVRSSSQALEFGIPFKFGYSFFDLSRYQYTPYLTAGFGYNIRHQITNSSLFTMGLSDASLIHSLTINYGFGFLVKMTEQTRFQVGLSGVSYFNSSKGPFTYATTGASLLFGIIVIFD